jgi:Septum formation
VSDDQPPPSPYQPAPVAQQTPRNGEGFAALILGIIGVLVGLIPALFLVAGILAVIALVLGFVGYSRVQRGEATNATTAMWGIITGAIAMILSVVGLLIQTGVFADRNEEPSVQTENTAAPTAEAAAPAEPEETATTDAENIYMGDLDVGDCLAELTGTETLGAETVPCSEPHSHEVFASVNLPDGDGEFPGYQAIDAQAEELCRAQFEGFVGLPYGESELEIRFITPSEESWLGGDRIVYCAVYDPAGEVSGSLRSAER